MTRAWACTLSVVGVILLPAVWLIVKSCGVGDRYLPSLTAVLQAFGDLEPNVFVHLGYTSLRVTIGLCLGVGAGVGVIVGVGGGVGVGRKH